MGSGLARCPDNESLALYILEKRDAFLAQDGYKEKLDSTLAKAYRNVCECKNPIRNLRDASQISGIGQWMLKLLKDFFHDASHAEELQESPCKESKRKRPYVPQKSSAPYAILLTLYKAMQEGREYMRKQELIDAADASGLSRMTIQPSKCSVPSGQFGFSTKDWYSGWSSMKTLVSKGLVVRSSCPAKYKLTEEGISTAEECIRRSSLKMETNAEILCNERLKKCSASVSSATQIDRSILKFNREFETHKVTCISSDIEDVNFDSFMCQGDHIQRDETLTINNVDNDADFDGLRLPPLMQGEVFLHIYEVVLLLDGREQFMSTSKGSSREKFVDQLRSQFAVEVEIRHLPIGDTLWIARHKVTREEYVLDFIVERKKVSDLLSSIRDTRYKQQKLRLVRCGLRKLIYVVEGDPNVMESAESIKTACFTTEIAEGFDVQRTHDVRDTMRLYGHLTHAICASCNELSRRSERTLCQTYRQFVDNCRALEKERVSDVFGVMLMQVKQVTEDIAKSILERYPTPLALVSAYTRLKGDEMAQKNLLKGIPITNGEKGISAAISTRIFHFISSNETINA